MNVYLVARVVGGILLALYVLPAALLFVFQATVIFPAPTISRAQLSAMAQEAGARELAVATADGETLYGWHIPAHGRKLVLYFHGNGESVVHTRTLQRELIAAGWDFMSVSPRGYPGSTGHPIAGSIATDARAAWEHATNVLGFDEQQIIVHGRSLGGGLVGTLLPDIQPAGVVLESTYLSLVEVGRDRFPLYPIRLLLRHRAPTHTHAPQFHRPVLVLHGDQDLVIAPRHGRELAQRFPNATHVEVVGFGHNENLLQNAPAAHNAWRTHLTDCIP